MNETEEKATPVEARTLTRADRCDGCNAEGFILVMMPGGGELVFCRHHGYKYMENLKKVALYVSDQTSLINAPTASA